MSKYKKVVYPPAGPDSYRIPFDDSFSRKPVHEQHKAIRERLVSLRALEQKTDTKD